MDYNCRSYIKNSDIVEANLESNIIIYDSVSEKTFYFNELGVLIWNGIDVYDDYSQMEEGVLKQIGTLNVEASCVISDIKRFVEKLIAIGLLTLE